MSAVRKERFLRVKDERAVSNRGKIFALSFAPRICA